MAMGGFTGSDPTPSLAQFQKWVRTGKIGYFISGGGFGGGGGGFGGRGGTSEITSWVEANYTSATIGGETVYNLTRPTTSTK